MTTLTQPYTVTVLEPSFYAQDDEVIFEQVYATEALADECIAWVTTNIVAKREPADAQAIIDRIQKEPYFPVIPVSTFVPNEIEDFFN